MIPAPTADLRFARTLGMTLALTTRRLALSTQILRASLQQSRLFANRICEAQTIYDIVKGTRHEQVAWQYLEAAVRIARIAISNKRGELAAYMRAA